MEVEVALPLAVEEEQIIQLPVLIKAVLILVVILLDIVSPLTKQMNTTETMD